jgi:carbon monoxide dehydrogenase subunit G
MIEPVLVKILKFDISPLEVEEDGKVTMNWQVEKASKIEFSYTGSQIYTLDASGTTEIPIVGKTTFTLKATDANSKVVTKSITVQVKKQPEPPTTDPGDGGDLRGNSGTTAGGTTGR